LEYYHSNLKESQKRNVDSTYHKFESGVYYGRGTTMKEKIVVLVV